MVLSSSPFSRPGEGGLLLLSGLRLAHRSHRQERLMQACWRCCLVSRCWLPEATSPVKSSGSQTLAGQQRHQVPLMRGNDVGAWRVQLPLLRCLTDAGQWPAPCRHQVGSPVAQVGVGAAAAGAEQRTTAHAMPRPCAVRQAGAHGSQQPGSGSPRGAQ